MWLTRGDCERTSSQEVSRGNTLTVGSGISSCARLISFFGYCYLHSRLLVLSSCPHSLMISLSLAPLSIALVLSECSQTSDGQGTRTEGIWRMRIYICCYERHVPIEIFRTEGSVHLSDSINWDAESKRPVRQKYMTNWSLPTGQVHPRLN
ncbi:hypothetical protein BD309DRAFT_135828 [Dichomitus squalens]|nr:hypothetical protein BD309DRAFT_135828 [Dichomitus squalens]